MRPVTAAVLAVAAFCLGNMAVAMAQSFGGFPNTMPANFWKPSTGTGTVQGNLVITGTCTGCGGGGGGGYTNPITPTNWTPTSGQAVVTYPDVSGGEFAANSTDAVFTLTWGNDTIDSNPPGFFLQHAPTGGGDVNLTVSDVPTGSGGNGPSGVLQSNDPVNGYTFWSVGSVNPGVGLEVDLEDPSFAASVDAAYVVNDDASPNAFYNVIVTQSVPSSKICDLFMTGGEFQVEGSGNTCPGIFDAGSEVDGSLICTAANGYCAGGGGGGGASSLVYTTSGSAAANTAEGIVRAHAGLDVSTNGLATLTLGSSGGFTSSMPTAVRYYGDTFIRANGDLAGAAPQYGGGTFANNGGGTWEVLSDAAVCSGCTGGGNGTILYVEGVGSANGSMSVTLPVVNATAAYGVIFRLEDQNNYLEFSYYEGLCYIIANIAASRNVLTSGVCSVAASDTMTAKFSGTSIATFINGVTTGVTYTTTDFETEVGYGLYDAADNAGNQFVDALLEVAGSTGSEAEWNVYAGAGTMSLAMGDTAVSGAAGISLSAAGRSTLTLSTAGLAATGATDTFNGAQLLTAYQGSFDSQPYGSAYGFPGGFTASVAGHLGNATLETGVDASVSGNFTVNVIDVTASAAVLCTQVIACGTVTPANFACGHAIVAGHQLGVTLTSNTCNSTLPVPLSVNVGITN